MACDPNEFLLYHPDLAPKLSSYGFHIPLNDERSQKVFSRLQEHFRELEPTKLSEIELLNRESLKLAHSLSYLALFEQDQSREDELKRIYQADSNLKIKSSDLMMSIMWQVSATYEALKRSLTSSFVFFLGGGMHHASTMRGDGFCPFNDLVVAARKAQLDLGLKNILIIDTDAHKGDGTAEITQNDATISTLSIHMRDSWPMPNETPGAQVDSDLDIEIGKGDETSYLALLRKGLESLGHRDFDACLVVAGADAFEKDELDSTQELKLSQAQMLERDMMVFEYLKSKKIPQAWVMAGGYGSYSHTIYTQFLLKVIGLMR